VLLSLTVAATIEVQLKRHNGVHRASKRLLWDAGPVPAATCESMHHTGTSRRVVHAIRPAPQV
jgi:hypothetical protein